jgi:iron complex outermembrane recepter protein
MDNRRPRATPLPDPRRSRQASWVAASLATAAAFSCIAEPTQFELPAGDASTLLQEFGRQANLQILYDYPQLKGMKTPPVYGTFEPRDVLRKLLEKLPLKANWVNERTLAIKPILTSTLSRDAPGLQRLRNAQALAGQQGEDEILVQAQSTQDQVGPAGASLEQLTRRDIELSPFSTVPELLRALPQVFGGGPSPDTERVGREADTNLAKGYGLNLRGLDAGATLVLIDGRRVAPSGTVGAFSDISNIPLSAVDHIDILPDGASARYGADAIGGVVNFVLRSQFVGAETHASSGGVTDGALRKTQASQLFGSTWDSGHSMIGLEYDDRSALPNADRAFETSDLRSFGGNNFDVPYASPGTIVVGSQTWAIPKAPHGALVPGVTNLYDPQTDADALPGQRRLNLYGTVSQSAGERVGVFGQFLLTDRTMQLISPIAIPLILTVPTINPFYENPAGGHDPVLVISGAQGYFGAPRVRNELHAASATVGANLLLSAHWVATASLDYAFEYHQQLTQGLYDPAALTSALSDTDPLTAFNAFGDRTQNNPSTLASISRTAQFRLHSSLVTAGLSAEGPVLALPAGDMRLSLGTDVRRQGLSTWMDDPVVSEDTSISRLSRTVVSEFATVTVPLFSPVNALKGARRLELSISSRYEHYSDVSGAAVPAAGLTWMPTANLTLNTMVSRSFRAPNLPDLLAKDSHSELTVVPDPNSPSGVSTVLGAFGSNPDLRPERARSWTLGAQWTPSRLPSVSFGLNFFDIHYTGRVESVSIDPTVLSNPADAWLVSRNVSTAQRQALCSRTVFAGDSTSCLTTPIAAIIDDRTQNIESLATRGIDLLGKWDAPVSGGILSFTFNSTYLLRYDEEKTPGAPIEALLSTQNEPIDLRFRAGAVWHRSGVNVAAYLNFSDAYRNISVQPSRPVASWTTLDLRMSYEAPAGTPFGGTEFALAVQNLTNAAPPFLNNVAEAVGYDQENADPEGRMVMFEVRKRW